MNVVCYPSDQNMCGLIRMSWVAQALRDQGKIVATQPRAPQIFVNTGYNPPVVTGINVGNNDVVILQRAASYQIEQVIEILQDNGKTIVLDIDDDLSCINPKNPAFDSYNPHKNKKQNWMWADRAYAKADLVTCTTEALAERYAPHGRVAILPNYIPASYLKIERPVNEVPVVGWAGWTKTHPTDLLVTGGLVNQALVETESKFLAIGDENIFNDLQIRNRPPNQYLGFVGIPEYARTLAKLDIGLVPLKDCQFNRAKSWLKALEYASVGTVPVVSPTPDNMKLVELGAAIPAAKPREWYERVKELIEDHDYRKEMSEKCRKVASTLTIEGNCHQWYEAWSNAHNGPKDYLV